MIIRILLADDHKMFVDVLRYVFEDQSDIEVVGEAGNGLDVYRLSKELKPDVVCMDIGMPGMSGIEATRRLVADCPGVRIIGLSSDARYVNDMLAAGASGYVTKDASSNELLSAIRIVHNGKPYVCSGVLATMAVPREGQAELPTPAKSRLGARERQILQLIAEGQTTTQMAAILDIAPATVDVHRRNLMCKLDLHGIAELTKYAIRNGMIGA